MGRWSKCDGQTPSGSDRDSCREVSSAISTVQRLQLFSVSCKCIRRPPLHPSSADSPCQWRVFKQNRGTRQQTRSYLWKPYMALKGGCHRRSLISLPTTSKLKPIFTKHHLIMTLTTSKALKYFYRCEYIFSVN